MGKIVFNTTNHIGAFIERVRFTTSGDCIFWMDDWPAGRVETKGGTIWAGRDTDWVIINNTIKLYHQRGENK